jgi:RimJ/RimL family protein N-acetyltransferase
VGPVGIETTHLYLLTAPPLARAVVAGVQVAPIERHVIASVAALGPCDPEDCDRRLERGDLCYGAWVDGELAHYSWVQLTGEHPIRSAGIAIAIEPGDRWIYNSRTSERFRGRGVYPAVLQYVATEQLAAGASCVWIYTSESNARSMHAIEKAGFRLWQTLHALRFGRRFRALGDAREFAIRRGS